MQHLGVELMHQGVQLVDGVEHLDAARVRVEAHLEWTRHGRHPAPELVLGVLEALGDIVHRLVFLVLVGLDGGDGRLEGSELGFVAQSVEQLTVGAQEAGAVGLDLSGLFAQAKFNRKPVYL